MQCKGNLCTFLRLFAKIQIDYNTVESRTPRGMIQLGVGLHAVCHSSESDSALTNAVGSFSGITFAI